jgi:hypothetical protein
MGRDCVSERVPIGRPIFVRRRLRFERLPALRGQRLARKTAATASAGQHPTRKATKGLLGGRVHPARPPDGRCLIIQDDEAQRQQAIEKLKEKLNNSERPTKLLAAFVITDAVRPILTEDK